MLMKYEVEFKAEVEGFATVEAESVKEARSKVRESLYPNYGHILNDDLDCCEKYDIKPKKIKN